MILKTLSVNFIHLDFFKKLSNIDNPNELNSSISQGFTQSEALTCF